jgi:carbon storage regulator CsrA
MLTLTRKLKEQILIGDTITVTVLRIHANDVRLGIEAPPDVHILRPEAKDKEHFIENEGTIQAAST